MNNFLKDKNKGVTLIELLFVVGILMILLLVVLVSLFSMRQKSGLIANAQQVVDVLRLAKSRTLASEGLTSYGVYFNSSSPQSYTLFKGASYGLNPADNIVYQLPNNIIFGTGTITFASNQVVFNRISGSANSGSVQLQLLSDLTQTASVYVETSGQIYLKEASVPVTTPVSDSRHVHFNMSGMSFTDALLWLRFPACPADDKSITFSSWLNIPKTEFSWEGNVSVCGETQKLKITTHSLDYFNFPYPALFSVHRDRRSNYNTKALQIFLNSENLLNYTANGEESRGTSGYLVGDPVRQ